MENKGQFLKNLSPKKKIIIAFSFLLLVFLGAAIRSAMLPPEKPSKQESSENDQPKGGIDFCFLFGDFKDSRNSGSSSELGNMVRMRFTARSTLECKEMLLAFCRKNLAKGNIPGTLGSIIRAVPNDPLEQRFTITKNCVLKAM